MSIKEGLDIENYRDFYEFEAEVYRTTVEKEPAALHRIRLVKSLLPKTGVGMTLDVGCGDGALCKELLQKGEYRAARIASKSFVIVADSAEVRLILSLQYGSGQEEPTQLEKPLRLYLGKKRGQWRIKSFIAAPDEGVPEEQRTP